MSGAIERVVASMPTQSRARWWLSVTSDAAARKASIPLVNTRRSRALLVLR